MASVITATNSSGLTTSADNSGVLQLASGTGNLVTVPSVTGTAMVSGNMPAFAAYLNNGGSNQNVSTATWTKAIIDTEEFDTNSCFNTSTYRFTPNVAGYYLIQGCIYTSYGSAGSTRIINAIYKNGAEWKRVQATVTSGVFYGSCPVSNVMYLNGTTDYVELYGYVLDGSLPVFVTGQNGTYFSGAMVRAA